MGKVLVTGGAGFVGAYVVDALVRAGREVVVYDAAVSNNTLDVLLASGVLGDRDAFGSQVTLLQGSVTDGWTFYRACEHHDVDSLVHLASPLTEDVRKDPFRGINEICAGTATAFEVARALGMRRLVWTSSIGIFGVGRERDTSSRRGGSVEWAPTLYGSCKQLCEVMARRYWEEDSVDSIGVRLTVVYGCGRLRGFMSYASNLIRDVALGRPVSIPFGAQRLDWQYVEDVAELVCTCLDTGVKGAGNVFTTGGDVRTYGEAAAVLHALDPEARISVSDAVDPALDGVVDAECAAFEDATGFTPKFSMEQGVEATYKRYRQLLSHEAGVNVGRSVGLW